MICRKIGEVGMPETIAEIMIRLPDSELIPMLKYIRDENGERVSLVELKHYLKECVAIDNAELR